MLPQSLSFRSGHDLRNVNEVMSAVEFRLIEIKKEYYWGELLIG